MYTVAEIKMKNKALTILLDSGSIAFFMLFPHLVPLPFYSYTVICLLAMWFLLKKKGKTFTDIGLSKEGLNLKAVVIGIASAMVWISFMQIIYIPIIRNLFVVPEYTEYNFIRGSLQKLIAIISAAFLVGGFYEEIIFRGYIQAIFEKTIFKGSRTIWSILSTGILFGLYHWQQDIYAIMAAIFGGIFWGILYKKFDNNLWVVIISHSIFDSITLVLIYTGKFGHLV